MVCHSLEKIVQNEVDKRGKGADVDVRINNNINGENQKIK